MPVNKSAIQRYRIIDRCIRNKANVYPSKQELKQSCQEELFGADDVHICDSTIEKDLRYMRMEHDAPIKFSRLHNGYYYEDDNYALDEMPLTSSDVDAIKLAANILSQFKNAPMFRQFEVAIDKIVNRVSIANDVQDEAIGKYVQFEKGNKIEGNEHLELILGAIKQRKVIQFEHQSFQNNVSKVRRVHPYLLKEYRNRWYLIGWSELREKVITFGLDRVKEVQLLSTTFKIDKGFDSDIFFKHSIGITTSDELPLVITLETTEVLSKYLLSQPLHHSQEYKGEVSGRHSFSYYLLVTYELKMQLLGFGADLKVLAPSSLVEELKEVSKKVYFQYS